MEKTNILFVCMMGRARSQKARQIINEEYKEKFEAKCVGVHPFADYPLNLESINWADKIICMEENHKKLLLEKFPNLIKEDISVWNISPHYSFEDPKLENLLKCKLKETFKI